MTHRTLERAGQLTLQHDITPEEFCELAALKAVIDYIDNEKNMSSRIRDSVANGRMVEIYVRLRRAKKFRDPSLRQLVIDFIESREIKRTRYFSVSDYLYYNEFLLPGFMRGFFADPTHVPSPLTFILPDIPQLRGKDIVLFGAGTVGIEFMYQIMLNKPFRAVAWVDSHAQELAQESGLAVVAPEYLSSIDFDYCLVAVESESTAAEIYNELISINITKEKIIWAFEKGIRT